MIRTFTFTFLLLTIITGTNCQSNNDKPVIKLEKIQALKKFSPLQESFDLKLDIKKVNDKEYTLINTIELENDSYVISPFSKDEVYGHFTVSLVENKHLDLEDSIIEFPESVEEYDSIIEEKVRFVREKTIYNQNIKLIETGDFEVRALTWFLIEPQCVPIDVEYVISYKEGKMEIKEKKISISKDYKGDYKLK